MAAPATAYYRCADTLGYTGLTEESILHPVETAMLRVMCPAVWTRWAMCIVQGKTGMAH